MYEVPASRKFRISFGVSTHHYFQILIPAEDRRYCKGPTPQTRQRIRCHSNIIWISGFILGTRGDHAVAAFHCRLALSKLAPPFCADAPRLPKQHRHTHCVQKLRCQRRHSPKSLICGHEIMNTVQQLARIDLLNEVQAEKSWSS